MQNRFKSVFLIALAVIFSILAIIAFSSLTMHPRPNDDAMQLINLSSHHSFHRGARATCQINVDIQYCHTQWINNVAISYCYWSHELRPGFYDPSRNCCSVLLPEMGGRLYCVPEGSTISLGPVELSARAQKQR